MVLLINSVVDNQSDDEWGSHSLHTLCNPKIVMRSLLRPASRADGSFPRLLEASTFCTEVTESLRANWAAYLSITASSTDSMYY